MTDIQTGTVTFYSNHVFNKADLQRTTKKLGLIERLKLRFHTTWIQIDDGQVWHYKIMNNKYYLIKIEPLPLKEGES